MHNIICIKQVNTSSSIIYNNLNFTIGVKIYDGKYISYAMLIFITYNSNLRCVHYALVDDTTRYRLVNSLINKTKWLETFPTIFYLIYNIVLFMYHIVEQTLHLCNA